MVQVSAEVDAGTAGIRMVRAVPALVGYAGTCTEIYRPASAVLVYGLAPDKIRLQHGAI